MTSPSVPPSTDTKDCLFPASLTYWGPVIHIYIYTRQKARPSLVQIMVCHLFGAQAIIWINARILVIGHLETNFSEIWLRIRRLSLKKMHLKMLAAKWQPFLSQPQCVNTLRQRQNGRHFADGIFLNENICISINISLKFVPRGQINNIPALVQIMVWCRPGDKSLSEPMVSLLAPICVITWPQWINPLINYTLLHKIIYLKLKLTVV